MPVDPTPAVSAAVELTASATQTVVDAAQAVTPDHVGDALDTAINIGNLLPHSQGSWIAIVLAGLVVARLVWKKYKSSQK